MPVFRSDLVACDSQFGHCYRAEDHSEAEENDGEHEAHDERESTLPMSQAA